MESIPTAADVAGKLAPMSYAQLEELARLSGVPFHTLLKIKSGDTSNPRLDTVGRFWPHIESVQREAA